MAPDQRSSVSPRYAELLNAGFMSVNDIRRMMPAPTLALRISISTFVHNAPGTWAAVKHVGLMLGDRSNGWICEEIKPQHYVRNVLELTYVFRWIDLGRDPGPSMPQIPCHAGTVPPATPPPASGVDRSYTLYPVPFWRRLLGWLVSPI